MAETMKVDTKENISRSPSSRREAAMQEAMNMLP